MSGTINVYIIEHPTRGVLKEWDFDPYESKYVFKFSWSGMRNDENLERFYTLVEARRVLDKMPEGLRSRCDIRSSVGGRWEVVG